MNCVKKFFKRTLVILLASMSLSLSVASSYQQGATAYASAVPVAVDGLIYLFEMALSGMGIAMTTDSFNDCYSSYKDYYYNYLYGTLSDEDRGKYATLEDLHKGDRINTQDYSSVIEDMQGFISTGVNLGNTVRAGSSATVVTGKRSVVSIVSQYIGGKCSESLVNFDVYNADKFLFIKDCGVPSQTRYPNYSRMYRIITCQSLSNKGCYLYASHVDANTDKIQAAGSGDYYLDSLYIIQNSKTGLMEYDSSGLSSGINVPSDGSAGSYIAKVCNVPIISPETVSLISTMGAVTFYQCLENAISLPSTIVIGGLDAVQAADDAIAKNPDATDDELAAAVTAAMAEQIAAEQETTQAVIEGNSWLEKIFNLLQSALNSIISALSAMGFLGTIVTLLQQVLSFPVEIAQQVAKVIPSYDVIVNAIQALPQAINGALDIPILGDILEVIISIPGTLADILEGLLTIPGVITDVVGGLAIPLPDLGILSDILEGVIAIPGALADVLEGIIAIPGIIVDAIEMVFTFDMAAVEVAADGLADAWELKLPFIPAFKNMFNKISFPDEYDYPVIKIQTPNALKEFWDHDYIILFNGEDFAPYFVYVRGITRAAIWILFAYSLLNRFKVRFHVG